MKPDFDPVHRTLDAAAEAGRPLRLWWRDDDATETGPALDRLHALAAGHGVPLVLAVIPARLTGGLAAWLEARPRIHPAQHGWAHVNHAGPGEKKSEFPASRPLAAALADLARGRAVLAERLGARPPCILVPPWNRLADAVAAAPETARAYALTSAFAGPARPGTGEAPGRVDCHLDPIAWKAGRGFAGHATLMTAFRAALAVPPDPEPPTVGLLTHHLAQDEATWDWIAAFLDITADHPGAVWPRPADLAAGSTPDTAAAAPSGQETC